EADTFVFEQPALAFESSAVAGERTVGADEAMAGNHDADRVGAVSEADRTHRQRTLQPLRHAPVAQRRSSGDLPQGAPYVALERRAAGLDGNLFDGLQFACEIALQRAARRGRRRAARVCNRQAAIDSREPVA